MAASKKTKWDDIVNEFSKYNCRLVSNENDYNNIYSTLTFLCEEDHENQCTLHCFKQRDRKCFLCDKNKVKQKLIKYDIDIVNTLFREKGYTLTTMEYQNCRQKLNYTCSKGHKNVISFTHFMQGGECLECKGKKKKNKITLEFIKNLCSENNFTLITDEYDGYEKKLKMICSNKHEIDVSYHSWASTNYSCFYCSHQKAKDKTRLSYDFVKAEFEKRDYVLLTNNYTNGLQKLEFICDKNHKGKMTFDSFYHKKSGCIECAGSKKYTIDTVKQLLENEDYTLLSETYKNNKQKIKYKCPNNHMNDIRFDMFVSGNRCPNCVISTKESKGELKIRMYLEENDIKFVTQHKILECKNKNPLPFDFYINNTFLLEYDGIQHFEDTTHFGGSSSYITRMHNDSIKNKYCIENNIPLLRISYQEYKQTNTIIEKFIDVLKTHDKMKPLLIFSNELLYKPQIDTYKQYISDNENKSKKVIKSIIKNDIKINIYH